LATKVAELRKGFLAQGYWREGRHWFVDPLGKVKVEIVSQRQPSLAHEKLDVMDEGFGLPKGSVDAVLLFNFLQCESPEVLLAHASHVLREGGYVLVIHWRHDPNTQRGPELAIRTRPEQIVAWGQATG
jgi:hypothetical protein